VAEKEDSIGRRAQGQLAHVESKTLRGPALEMKVRVEADQLRECARQSCLGRAVIQSVLR
jgi:hypothetical protein